MYSDESISTAELCVGIVCACLPCMAPVFSKQFLASLVPTSLQIYLRSLQGSGSRVGQDTSKAINHHTGSDIELVRASHSGGGTNRGPESTNFGSGIQHTKDFTVNYVQQPNSSVGV